MRKHSALALLSAVALAATANVPGGSQPVTTTGLPSNPQQRRDRERERLARAAVAIPRAEEKRARKAARRLQEQARLRPPGRAH